MRDGTSNLECCHSVRTASPWRPWGGSLSSLPSATSSLLGGRAWLTARPRHRQNRYRQGGSRAPPTRCLTGGCTPVIFFHNTLLHSNCRRRSRPNGQLANPRHARTQAILTRPFLPEYALAVLFPPVLKIASISDTFQSLRARVRRHRRRDPG